MNGSSTHTHYPQSESASIGCTISYYTMVDHETIQYIIRTIQKCHIEYALWLGWVNIVQTELQFLFDQLEDFRINKSLVISW